MALRSYRKHSNYFNKIMTSPFSAGPQAVGYLHQVRYALYALLREPNEEAAVVIEGLDDIEVRDREGLPIRLDQLKHIKSGAKLTDTHSNLWKTIRIWASQMGSRTWEPAVTKLQLITTAEAPQDSAAWYLRPESQGNRDPTKAHSLLLQAVNASRTSDKAVLEGFAKFQALSERDQLNLLRAVTIFDGAETITELPALIKQQIRWAAPPSVVLLNQLYENLEGWWFTRAVEHLVRSSQDPLSQMELRRKLWSITEQLREDSLPISHAEATPDEEVDPLNDNRTFVRQLRCLHVSAERIRFAILDYYRAFEQRASWVRQDLLIDDELLNYERKLVEEWTQYRLALQDDLSGQDADVETRCRKIGLEILRWAHTIVDIRIRPNVTDRFVLRGSYHMLADADRPRVYWHPRFLERLEELLTS